MMLRPAEIGDLETILQWRRETAAWLRDRYGIDQWSNPYPPAKILGTIEAGQVWMLHDDGPSIATVTVIAQEDDERWTAEERHESAHYVHKLNVVRAYSGQNVGSALLDWASRRAATMGAQWLRLDAWTTNPHLRQYYLDRGFEYVRTVKTPGIVSGALFQRPAGVVLGQGPHIEEVSAGSQNLPCTPGGPS